MRIHSDALDTIEIRKAARMAGVRFTRFDLYGSRSREQAWDIILTGSSSRQQNGGPDKAATWDEWGCVLQTLFTLDPDMVTPYYDNADHFAWVTASRFFDFDLNSDAHHRAGHRWEYTGESVTGAYMAHECQCGAIRRFLNYRTWAEFVEATS